MKYGKEIRVGVLAVIALFLLYFGFNYLKGINVFHRANTFVAVFPEMNGLVAQSPVYVRGYKVGMVDAIHYDFRKRDAFLVTFSINQDISLPKGTQVALVSDGLISGEALELRIPVEGDSLYCEVVHELGDTIPSLVEPGMIAGLTSALMTKIDPMLEQVNPILANVDSILYAFKVNFTEEQLAAIMRNVDGTMANANGITLKFDDMMGGMKTKVPAMLDSVQLVLSDVHEITANLAATDFQATILKLDTAVNGVNEFVQKVNSTEGTIGMLLNDKDLYISLNNTVTSADSLLIDLKAHPKRYVHFSLFGKKDK